MWEGDHGKVYCLWLDYRVNSVTKRHLQHHIRGHGSETSSYHHGIPQVRDMSFFLSVCQSSCCEQRSMWGQGTMPLKIAMFSLIVRIIGNSWWKSCSPCWSQYWHDQQHHPPFFCVQKHCDFGTKSLVNIFWHLWWNLAWIFQIL